MWLLNVNFWCVEVQSTSLPYPPFLLCLVYVCCWFYFIPSPTTATNLLSELQDGGGAIGDVRLPPWAKTPEEFVWTNRMALESEFVSTHLHHWIDLIFGAKQSGPASEAADNVFYFLTYENQVLLDSVSDPMLKQSLTAQIANFGQTPVQLFRRLHVPRLTASACPVPLLRLATPLRPASAAEQQFADAPATQTSRSLDSGPLRVPLDLFVQDAPGTVTPGAAMGSTEAADFLVTSDHRESAIVADQPLKRWAALPAVTIPFLLPSATTAAETAAAGISAGLGVYTALCLAAGGAATMSAQQTARTALATSAVTQVAGSEGSSAAIVAAASAALTRDRDQGAVAAAKPFIMTAATATCPRDQQLAFLACIGGRTVCTIMGDASFALHRWSPLLTESGLPFDIRPDKLRALACSSAAASSIATSGRCAGAKLNPSHSYLLAIPSDAAATSANLAALSGASQAISLASCYSLMCLPVEGSAPAVSAFGPGGVRSSSSSQGGAGSGNGNTADVIIFSSGYVDGSLRWQLLPGSARGRSAICADSWDSRVAGAGDVTCVAAAAEGGGSGCGDESSCLVTGHSDGQVRQDRFNCCFIAVRYLHYFIVVFSGATLARGSPLSPKCPCRRSCNGLE